MKSDKENSNGNITIFTVPLVTGRQIGLGSFPRRLGFGSILSMSVLVNVAV
ncbi:hypothetical protein J6590_074726 [Homalodisca vitripennis]|nr:hypothetical protein J6590_074726 [Homalodisca vitripennis]